MTPVRTMLAAGLVACLSGCSNLNQSLLFRPASERALVDRAPAQAQAEPADLFHRPYETPAARMARYFPGLARSEKVAPPASEGTPRRPGNPDLRAVPRDAAPEGEGEAEASTAARPRSGRPRAARAEVAATRDEPTGRLRPTSLPLLGGSVLAETDPADAPRQPPGLPELTPAERALRAVRVAEMSSGGIRSTRRMPPVPEVNPAARRPAPEVAVAARRADPHGLRPAARDEDSQARRVRARAEDDPAPAEAKPAATVTEAEPAESRSLAPPEDEAKPVAAPVPPDERPQPVADRPAVDAPEPEPEPGHAAIHADGPPPIDPPASEPEARREARPAPVRTQTQTQAAADPDTGGDPTLAGRPRLAARVEPVRDHVPPDLPAVTFPRSYYTSGDLARATRPKLDPETRPARWTWTPKLLRRLRGGDGPVEAGK